MKSHIVLYFCVSGVLLTERSIHISAYENVALNKLAWQQYPYPNVDWGAEKAVDGRYTDRSAPGGQCAISANDKTTATWRVDLGEVLSIHHITFYFRTDNVQWDSSHGYTGRVLGFSVYLSNTTNKDDGILCFKDNDYTRATVPNVTTLECIKHGRYVIYYNERLPGVTYPEGYSTFAFSSLCEVEVYGCATPGFYGIDCNLPCPKHCQETHCNIVSGSCLGCIAGFKGPRCKQQCDNNTYGLECSLACGNCSNGEQCNHVNGSCPKGCDVGTQGYTCDEACPFGRSGKNCVELCNPNCKGGCDRFTGGCKFGCYPGWKGIYCENECDALSYGANCSILCGSCVNFKQCHHINGTCLNGCDRGFQGEKCKEVCPIGRFGYNCQDICSLNCGVPVRCDRVTGQCQGGCQEGWKGPKCDKKCSRGKFGLNCAQSCGVCLDKEQCHHINGSCLNGCDRGYQGINCTHVCPDGMYGYNCQETCSKNCKVLRTCDTISGQCSVIGQPSDSDRNSVCYPSLYGVISILCLSIAFNIFFVIWFLRNRTNMGQDQETINAKQLSTDQKSSHTDIYEKVEDNPGYQELDQISRPSYYDKLH